jgi:starvation-inducible DNA-binding protein
MKRLSPAKEQELKERQEAPLHTPTDLTAEATQDITAALNAILADVFALYLKTKNFHWHLSGPHFRDHHLMFDEHADQLFAMTDPIAERVRKIGGSTIKSISHISRLQRVLDNDAEYVDPEDMLAELGALAAILGGLDVPVFTGGIGEHAAAVRRRIAEGLEFLGVRIDPRRNEAHAPVISPDGGQATVRVMKTDEDLMIARHTRELIGNSG